MRQLLKRSCAYSRLLVCFALLMTCLYSLAQARNQHDNTLTLSGSNLPLSEIFRAIKQQTGISVMYSKAVTGLDQGDQITVRFYKTPLDQVLAVLFKGKDLEWSYNDNVVLIRKKEKPPGDPVKKSDGDSSINSSSISGKVTDAAGLPLPGATVKVKGEMQGAITDVDGKFTLPKVGSRDLLVISSVGYETQEIPIRGKTILAQLNVVVNELDETVVTAYSTTTKRLSTGNISMVKGEDIARQPVSNPLLALEGRVPGLFIRQNNGLSGTVVSVIIQGQNSILSGNDPFYVIDGVPYSSQLLPNLGGVLGAAPGTGIAGNPLSFINPSDIESVTVLKDADATAIYGSRAANGAILITTRKGKAGQTKVDFNVQQGWGMVTRKLELLNTPQYLAMRKEAYFINDGYTTSSPRYQQQYDINGLWDTTRYTDWQKELIGHTAQYTNLSATVTGGTSLVQYLIGGTYRRETTVFPGEFSDRKGSLHFSVNSISTNQKFRIQLTGSYMVDNNRLPSYDLTDAAIKTPPNAPALYNSDGTINWAPDASGTSSWTNPLWNSVQEYSNLTKNLVSNVILSYQVAKGLELKSSFGYTNMQVREFNTIPLISVQPENRPYTPRIAVYGNNNVNSWIIEPQLTYSKNIGHGKLEALIGTTIQQNNGSVEQVTGMGYASDEVLKNMGAATSLFPGTTLNTVYKYNALFGRLNYNWKDKYIINLSARRDGSSRFGSANRFHNFAGAGIGWIFSQESFIKNNISVLSFGKLRASYGSTGSDQFGDYKFMDQYLSFPVGVAYQGVSALVSNGLTNPYLQWEETKKLQLGLEIGLMNDRVLFNAGYFHNRSSNQLLGYSLPIVTGFSGIIRNFPATVQNTGWEFSASSTNIKNKNFSWSSSLNLTIPRNKLVAFPGLENTGYASSLIIGEPVNVIKAYRFAGVDATTGLYQFSDDKGNPTSNPDFLKDAKVLISTAPKFYGGFQNSISFKGFQFDMLVQFVKQTGLDYPFGYLPGRRFNQPVSVLDRWQQPGDKASIQRFGSDSRITPQWGFANVSDAAYRDASFIRLKTISLSWQFPSAWKQKLRLQNCSLYLQGQNLLTITGYKGFDPETQSNSVLPPLRILTAGFQVGL